MNARPLWSERLKSLLKQKVRLIGLGISAYE